MQILHARHYPATPWKNGGGITRQVLIAPPDATLDNFDYRISIASVASDGDFSRFPGIDRQLLLLQGAALLLQREDGSEVRLDAFSLPLAFAGEESISSQLTEGPVIDFNVMTRRGRYLQQVEDFTLNGERQLQSDDEVLLVLLAAGAELEISREDGRSCRLQPQDALLQQLAIGLTLRSSAAVRVIVVRLNRLSAA